MPVICSSERTNIFNALQYFSRCRDFKNGDDRQIPYHRHHVLKINGYRTNGIMRILTSPVIVAVIMPGPVPEKRRETLVLWCMAHIESKRSIANKRKFLRGLS